MAYFFYIVLTPISTPSGLRSTGNTRKYMYQQIDVYIYQCETMTTCQLSIYICIILHVSASSQSARPILENTGNQNLLPYAFLIKN